MNIKSVLGFILIMAMMAVPVIADVEFEGDNFLINGTQFNETVFINNTVNATFNLITFNGSVFVNNATNLVINNSKFFGDLTITNSSEVDARTNYWNTTYAPLHTPENASRGCPDGDGQTISGNALASPWYRNESLTDASGNCNPLIANISDVNTPAGSLVSFTVGCTDPNTGDSLVFTDNSSLYVIGASSGLISFTASGQGTTGGLGVTCSDSEFTDNTQWSLTVGSGYSAFYASENVGDVIIDLVVGIGTFIVNYISLIALFLISGVLLIAFNMNAGNILEMFRPGGKK